MLNYYKSKTNYDQRSYFSSQLLAHPSTNSEVAINMICPAGNVLGWLFGFLLFFKDLAFYNSYNLTIDEKIAQQLAIKIFMIPILFIGILMSTINLNALLYLSPIFIIETIKIIFI